MSQGTLTLFNEFRKSIADGRMDMDNDSIQVALTTLQVGGTPEIAADDAVPCWGAGGTTDLSASEVAAGGGYSSGGILLTSTAWSLAGAVCTFDADDAIWTSAGAGDPATIKSAVLYNGSAANLDAIGFIDMTADGTTAISLLAGDVKILFNASGIFTLS